MDKLLLLHGALGAKEEFNSLAESLKNDFEIYSLNFSGHGGKSLPSKPFSINLFADEVIEFLHDNNIKSINVFGYSMGGYVAAYLAMKHPDRIDRIFTVATKFHWDEAVAKKEIQMMDPITIEEKLPAFALQLKERHAPNDWKVLMKMTADMLLAMGMNPPIKLSDLAMITTKIQVALGDRDQMVTKEETLVAFSALKDANLLILPGVKHPYTSIPVERLVYEIKAFF